MHKEEGSTVSWYVTTCNNQGWAIAHCKSSSAGSHALSGTRMHFPIMKVCTAVLVVVAAPLVASWTQQYGDPSSTSYVDYQGKAYVGWNYTTEPFVSQTSPSVTEEGVMFYPLRTYLIALSPRGTVLWKTGVAPNGEAYQTNTVYSKVHDIVVVGSSWVDQNTFFQIVAIHAGNGSVAWQSMQNELYHATTISISTSADAVYAGGFDNSTFAALRLKDGSLLWRKAHISNLGIFMQTKVGPFSSNLAERAAATAAGKETVLLATDPFDGFEGKGRLFSYDVSKPGSIDWHSDLGFSAGGLFAFSSNGVIFGSDGGSGGADGQAIFGVHSSNGSVLFNSGGYCERGPWLASGPTVDADGYAYYRWVLCSLVPRLSFSENESLGMRLGLNLQETYSSTSPKLSCSLESSHDIILFSIHPVVATRCSPYSQMVV